MTRTFERNGAGYPVSERAAVFLKAVLEGREPMVEVALEGLSRPHLPEALQIAYARRVLAKGGIREFLERARMNPLMCKEANGLAVEAVERRSERIMEQERRRPQFVFDE